MRHETSGVLQLLALAAVFLVQGCAKQEPPDKPQVASTPAPQSPAGPPAAAVSSTATGTTTPAATTSVAASGQKVYATFCTTCHGPGGKGDGPAAASLNPKPTNFAAAEFKYDVNGNGRKGDVEDIKAIVHDGAAKHGGSPLMAPWPMIAPDQLQALAEHVASLRGG